MATTATTTSSSFQCISEDLDPQKTFQTFDSLYDQKLILNNRTESMLHCVFFERADVPENENITENQSGSAAENYTCMSSSTFFSLLEEISIIPKELPSQFSKSFDNITLRHSTSDQSYLNFNNFLKSLAFISYYFQHPKKQVLNENIEADFSNDVGDDHSSLTDINDDAIDYNYVHEIIERLIEKNNDDTNHSGNLICTPASQAPSQAFYTPVSCIRTATHKRFDNFEVGCGSTAARSVKWYTPFDKVDPPKFNLTDQNMNTPSSSNTTLSSIDPNTLPKTVPTPASEKNDPSVSPTGRLQFDFLDQSCDAPTPVEFSSSTAASSPSKANFSQNSNADACSSNLSPPAVSQNPKINKREDVVQESHPSPKKEDEATSGDFVCSDRHVLQAERSAIIVEPARDPSTPNAIMDKETLESENAVVIEIEKPADMESSPSISNEIHDTGVENSTTEEPCTPDPVSPNSFVSDSPRAMNKLDDGEESESEPVEEESNKGPETSATEAKVEESIWHGKSRGTQKTAEETSHTMHTSVSAIETVEDNSNRDPQTSDVANLKECEETAVKNKLDKKMCVVTSEKEEEMFSSTSGNSNSTDQQPKLTGDREKTIEEKNNDSDVVVTNASNVSNDISDVAEEEEAKSLNNSDETLPDPFIQSTNSDSHENSTEDDSCEVVSQCETLGYQNVEASNTISTVGVIEQHADGQISVLIPFSSNSDITVKIPSVSLCAQSPRSTRSELSSLMESSSRDTPTPEKEIVEINNDHPKQKAYKEDLAERLDNGIQGQVLHIAVEAENKLVNDESEITVDEKQPEEVLESVDYPINEAERKNAIEDGKQSPVPSRASDIGIKTPRAKLAEAQYLDVNSELRTPMKENGITFSSGGTGFAIFADTTPAELESPPDDFQSPELSEPEPSMDSSLWSEREKRILNFVPQDEEEEEAQGEYDERNQSESDTSSDFSSSYSEPEAVGFEPFNLDDETLRNIGEEVDDSELSDWERAEEQNACSINENAPPLVNTENDLVVTVIDSTAEFDKNDRTYDTSFFENSEEILAQALLGSDSNGRRDSFGDALGLPYTCSNGSNITNNIEPTTANDMDDGFEFADRQSALMPHVDRGECLSAVNHELSFNFGGLGSDSGNHGNFDYTGTNSSNIVECGALIDLDEIEDDEDTTMGDKCVDLSNFVPRSKPFENTSTGTFTLNNINVTRSTGCSASRHRNSGRDRSFNQAMNKEVFIKDFVDCDNDVGTVQSRPLDDKIRINQRSCTFNMDEARWKTAYDDTRSDGSTNRIKERITTGWSNVGGFGNSDEENGSSSTLEGVEEEDVTEDLAKRIAAETVHSSDLIPATFMMLRKDGWKSLSSPASSRRPKHVNDKTHEKENGGDESNLGRNRAVQLKRFGDDDLKMKELHDKETMITDSSITSKDEKNNINDGKNNERRDEEDEVISKLMETVEGMVAKNIQMCQDLKQEMQRHHQKQGKRLIMKNSLYTISVIVVSIAFTIGVTIGIVNFDLFSTDGYRFPHVRV